MLGIRTIIIFSLIFWIKINFQINIVVLRLENSWKSRILFNFIKVNQNLVWELNHVNLKSSSVHSARTKFNKNTLSIMSLSYREKISGRLFTKFANICHQFNLKKVHPANIKMTSDFAIFHKSWIMRNDLMHKSLETILSNFSVRITDFRIIIKMFIISSVYFS